MIWFGVTMVQPNKPVIGKLRDILEAWEKNEVVRLEFERVERLAGLVSYTAAFLDSRRARKARWKMIWQLAAGCIRG